MRHRGWRHSFSGVRGLHADISFTVPRTEPPDEIKKTDLWLRSTTSSWHRLISQSRWLAVDIDRRSRAPTSNPLYGRIIRHQCSLSCPGTVPRMSAASPARLVSRLMIVQGRRRIARYLTSTTGPDFIKDRPTVCRSWFQSVGYMACRLYM